MSTAVHDAREGVSVEFKRAPECGAHRLNYDEKVPATFIRKIQAGWQYLCNECHTLFADPDQGLGTGVGQMIVVGPNGKQPPPADPIPDGRAEPEHPKAAKAAPAKRAPAKAAEPTAAQKQVTEQVKLRGAARKAAANKAPARKAAAAAPPPLTEAQQARVAEGLAKVKAELSEAGRADYERRVADQKGGPPEGHVQQPGTKWTPSDPQQAVPEGDA